MITHVHIEKAANGFVVRYDGYTSIGCHGQLSAPISPDNGMMVFVNSDRLHEWLAENFTEETK